MKSILFTAAFAMLFGSAFAQKMKAADVPAAITAKFKADYPKVASAKWEKEGANYEAEFELNEVEMSVLYDANASVVETEVEIKVGELPKAVTDYMTGKKIKEASKITDAAGKVTYEAESGGKDYIFDDAGKFIKSVDGD